MAAGKQNNMAAGNEIRVLLFEGPDKVGKTTIIKALNRATDYAYLCVDRSLGSAWVYDQISGRRDRVDTLQRAEQELSTLQHIKFINILLTCKVDELRKRISAKDEFPDLRLARLTDALQAYEEYAHSTKLPTITVDTTNLSVPQTVTKIVKELEKL